MKTQQTSLMMTLLGAHGGEVLFVVVVVLQPRVVHVFTTTCSSVDPASGTFIFVDVFPPELVSASTPILCVIKYLTNVRSLLLSDPGMLTGTPPKTVISLQVDMICCSFHRDESEFPYKSYITEPLQAVQPVTAG